MRATTNRRFAMACRVPESSPFGSQVDPRGEGGAGYESHVEVTVTNNQMDPYLVQRHMVL